MKYNYKNRDSDWAKEVPDVRYRGPYEDYGWEADSSVLPQFRDPSVRLTREERRRMQESRRRTRGREVAGETNRYSQGQDWDDDNPEYGWSQYYGQPFSRGYAGESYTSGREDWMNQGPYTGRGPKGYQRSDERILEDACQRLTAHGLIDARNIQVQVQGGEVTLTGLVDSRRTRRLVEETIDTVSGIQDIHNQLTVQNVKDQQVHRQRE